MSEDKDTKVLFIDLAELCRELNTLTNRQFRPGHQLVKLYHALSRFSQVSEYYKDEEQVLQLFNIYNLESKHTHPYVITQLAKIYQLEGEEQKVALAKFANRLDEHEQWEWESRRKAKTRRKAQQNLQAPHIHASRSLPDLSAHGGHPSPIPSPASMGQTPLSRTQSFTKLSLGSNLAPPLDNESRQTSYSSMSSEESHRYDVPHDFEHKKTHPRFNETDYPSDKSWPKWSDWMGGLKKWWDGDDRERYEAEMFYREQQQKYGDYPRHQEGDYPRHQDGDYPHLQEGDYPRHQDYPRMRRSAGPKYGSSSFEGTREHLTRSRQYYSMNDLSRLQYASDRGDYHNDFYDRADRHPRQRDRFHPREHLYKGGRFEERPIRKRVIPAFPDDLDYERFSRI